MREKLIELLKNTRANAAWHHWGYEESADHLIANGVTILTVPKCNKINVKLPEEIVVRSYGDKWIPVTERLPEEEGWYQVYTTPDRGQKSINKAMFHKGFEWDNYTPRWHGAGGYWANVTHWMPLPPAPTTCHMTSEQQTRGE